MAIRGRVIHVGQPEQGVGKTTGKQWSKQVFAIETEGQYPKKVAFGVMNGKFTMNVGDVVEIEVDAQSREYNGKWYTELTCWRCNNHRQLLNQLPRHLTLWECKGIRDSRHRPLRQKLTIFLFDLRISSCCDDVVTEAQGENLCASCLSEISHQLLGVRADAGLDVICRDLYVAMP